MQILFWALKKIKIIIFNYCIIIFNYCNYCVYFEFHYLFLLFWISISTSFFLSITSQINMHYVFTMEISVLKSTDVQTFARAVNESSAAYYIQPYGNPWLRVTPRGHRWYIICMPIDIPSGSAAQISPQAPRV